MATLTRFISEPDTRAAINPSRADPSAWSAADVAAGHAAEQTGNSFQNMVGGIAKAMGEGEKVDHLYLAQAKADMQVGYNKQLEDLQSKATAGGNFEGDATQAFDGLAQNFVKNAPNAKTQESLMASMIGMRANSQLHAGKYQKAIDYQDDMNTFTQTSNALMGLGVKDPRPENVANLKSQIEQYAQRMTEKGYDAKSVNKTREMIDRNFDTAIANKTAVSDPASAINNLDSGAYAHLGPTVEQTIRTKAEAQFGAQMRDLKKSHDDIQSRIINDQAIPADVTGTLSRAQGIAVHHPEVMTQFKELAGLQAFAENMRARPIKDQEMERIRLASTAKDNPDLSVKAVENMDKVLSTNIKSMKEDPLGYSVKHNLVELPPLPDNFNDPRMAQALSERRLGASRAEQITGQPALPFTNGELEQFTDKITKAAPQEQAQAIQVLGGVDPALAPRIAENVVKGGAQLPLATAMQLGAKNPNVSQMILKGVESMQKGGTMKESNADERNRVSSDVKALFPGDIKTQDQILNSADAYRAGLGEHSLKEGHVRDMLNVIEPGKFAGVFGGYKTIAPRPDMTGDDFSRLTKSLTPKNIQDNGNGGLFYSPGQPFDFKNDSLSNYQFKPVDIYSGKYYVMRDGKGLKNDSGDLYKIDLKSIA